MRGSPLRFLVLAVLISGLGPVLVRDSPVGPAATAFWRLATPLPFAIWYGANSWQMSTRDVAWALLAGLLLAADLVLWNGSILKTSVMEATVLVMVFPLLVAAAEIGFFGRKLGKNLLAGGALAFAGTIVIAFDAARGESNLVGDLMALGAAVFYALSMLITSHLCRRNDTRGVTFWVMLGGAFGTLPVALTEAVAMPRNLYETSYLCFYGIITFAAYTLYNRALSELPATIVAVSSYGQPVIATALAFILLHETPSIVNMVGAAIIMAGLFMATAPSRKAADAAMATKPDT